MVEVCLQSCIWPDEEGEVFKHTPIMFIADLDFVIANFVDKERSLDK